jgi:hypothetical protein
MGPFLTLGIDIAETAWFWGSFRAGASGIGLSFLQESRMRHIAVTAINP